MSLEKLHRGLFPKSAAVLGDAGDAGGLCQRLVDNIEAGRFPGGVYPILTGVETVGGRKAYPSLDAVGAPVDLAILAGPFARAFEAVRACARAQIPCLIIPARSDPAPGPAAELRHLARSTGVRLIGPRSWGVVSPWASFNAGPGETPPIPGRLAVIAQSGAFCASLLDLALAKQIGLSLLVGLGDALDVDAADLIDYLANHFRAGAILLHIERLSNLRRFMSAARAASRVKPIMVLKTGRYRSDAWEQANAFGPTLAPGPVYDAAFRRAGVIRCETVEDLFDCGDLVGKQPRPHGSNLAVLTNTRSPGVMALDFLIDRGFDPLALRPETVSALNRTLAGKWSAGNPAAVYGEITSEQWRLVMETLLAATEADGILCVLAPGFLADPAETARALVAAVARKTKPVLFVWLGGRGMEAGRRVLEEAGFPVYDAPERAIRAFLHLREHDRNLAMLQETPPRLTGVFTRNAEAARGIIEKAGVREGGLLEEPASLDLLTAYGLPAAPAELVRSIEEAVAAAERHGRPVSLRLKTSRGPDPGPPGSSLGDLRDPTDVAYAYHRLFENFEGRDLEPESFAVLVRPDFGRPEIEMCIGSRQLPPFGPVIFLGQGGLGPDASTDLSLGLPPLNRLLARRVIQGSRSRRALERLEPILPDGAPAIEDALVKLSHLVTDFPEIEALEMNPAIVANGRFVILGARVLVRPTHVQAPMHLIVSPYPDEYESMAKTRSGLDIFIRPIRPEDAPLLQAFWAELSPRSIYYRFSRTIKALTAEMLIRFTQIDYDREIALVAFPADPTDEKMLAVARLHGEPGDALAEFSVIVGDPWQGRGVGAALLESLFAIAARRKIKKLWGLVLRENRGMIDLARRFGCDVTTTEDASQVEISLELGAAADCS